MVQLKSFLAGNTLRGIIFIVTIFIFKKPISAQTVHEGDLFLTTQAQIDDFNYHTINGGLYIGSDDTLNYSIQSLDKLSVLKTINGNLEIFNCYILPSLNGLQQLNKVQGDVFLEHNAFLMDINELNTLQSIGGSLYILNNLQLSDLSGLNMVSEVNNLYIIENDSIWELDAFHELLEIKGDLQILYNDNIEKIGGFPKLTSVAKDLRIERNSRVLDIEGLFALKSIGGYLKIEFNELLRQVDGFNSLERVGGNFTIEANNALEDINGFKLLKEVDENITINSNNRLVDINGIGNINRVNGNLYITNNEQLSACCGIIDVLENTNSISGMTWVRGNAPGCYNKSEIIENCNQADEGQVLSDKDGNTYQTVQIGNQVWMAENLRSTKCRDAGVELVVSGRPPYLWDKQPRVFWYFYNEASKESEDYGLLYSSFAVNACDICPEGWRLPTKQDFQTLIDHLGTKSLDVALKLISSTELWSNYRWNWLDEEEAKLIGQAGWEARPGALYSYHGSDEFSYSIHKIGKAAFWWFSSDDRLGTFEISNNNQYYPPKASINNFAGLQYAHSIRCIKED